MAGGGPSDREIYGAGYAAAAILLAIMVIAKCSGPHEENERELFRWDRTTAPSGDTTP